MEPQTYSEAAAEIIKGVDLKKHPNAQALCEEVLFMADKLKLSRQQMENAAIVIKYDNGGGQRGLRKNPLFEAYNSLFNSFSKGLGQLDDMLSEVRSSEQGKSKLAELRLIEGKRKAQ